MDTPQSIPEKDGTATEFATATMPWSRRIVSRFTSDIDTSWADTILVGCFFVSGIVDSVVFSTYTCFVSMQTGETVERLLRKGATELIDF